MAEVKPMSIIAGFMILVLVNASGVWIAARALEMAGVIDDSFSWRISMILAIVYVVLRAFNTTVFTQKG